MPEFTTNSLVNLGDISKTADTLIKKVSKAVGGFFAPYQIKRVAEAEAEAAIIRAQTEIQITDLHRRAMHRFIEEEATRQANIESITGKAIPLLTDDSNADEVDDDWVTNFFDKSRIVSDNEMQELWARVLAGEANAPGTYSKRTVNFIGDLDKGDAELFAALCGFGFHVGNVVPLVFDVEDAIYNSHRINFSSLIHLESIGLIQFNNLQGFVRCKLPKHLLLFYYGAPLQLELPNTDGENQLELGHVLLTKTGQELAPICGSTPVPEFLDYVRGKWKANLPKEATEQSGEPEPPITQDLKS